MKEYIEREAGCAVMPDDYYGWRDKKLLKSIPAADVRPVVKSKWVKMKFFPDWECEKCGSVISGNTPDPWNYYHYCPNCGAVMEES